MSPGFEENMNRGRRRSPSALIRVESPTLPLGDQLIACEPTPGAHRLRARAMGHHAKRELIAPEVAAESVVRDVNVHKSPSNLTQTFCKTISAPTTRVSRRFSLKHPRVFFRFAHDNAAPIYWSRRVESEEQRQADLSTSDATSLEGAGFARSGPSVEPTFLQTGERHGRAT